jgi:hypothetical protein
MSASTKHGVLAHHLQRQLEAARDEIFGDGVVEQILDWVLFGGVADEMAILQVDKKFLVDLWEDDIFPFLQQIEEKVAALGDEEP